MRILVTGANGLVGNALADLCRAKNDEVAALSHSALDITDLEAVRSAVSTRKPDAIINCAAYTDVDGAETARELCYAVNKTGVGNLASAAKEYCCRFLTISTDFVFDGEKEGFYTEQDKPNPQSVYGKAKLAGEQAAFAAYEESIVVRTGWVFGHGGTNFLSVLPRLLASGQSVSAIGDSYGTPTYSNDLAARLRDLIVLDTPGTYHVSNKGSGTSYHGFALFVEELGGYKNVSISNAKASDLKRPAARPRNSRLATVMLETLDLTDLPDWKNALKGYLSEN